MSSIIKVGKVQSSTGQDAVTIANSGAITANGALTASGGIKVADGGNIGSASDTDAISISSGGIVTVSQYLKETAKINFALTNNTSESKNIANDGHIPFQTKHGNMDSSLTTGNGSFVTIPVTGVWLFMLQIYWYEDHYRRFTILHSNDGSGDGSTTTGLADVVPNDDGGQKETISCAVGAFHCSAGDKVHARNISGTTAVIYMTVNRQHTTFQGVFLG